MSAPDNGCFICQKHSGEAQVAGGIIYRDDLIAVMHLAVPASGLVYLGYLFIETIRHVPGLPDLTPEESARMGVMMTRLSRALKASERAEHVYAVVFGDHIPHMHVHVVARYPGAPREYWGIKVDDWPGAPRGGAEQVEALCARVRKALETA